MLYITGEYPPMRGGVGDYTARLVEAIAPLGWEPMVLTSGAAGRNEDPRVLARLERWGWSLGDEVSATIQEVDPSLIHIEYQTGAFALHPAVNLLPRRLRRLGLPVVTTFHDLREPYLFPKAGPVRRWANRAMAAFSSAIVATNEPDRRELARDAELDRRTHVIPIGSNLPAAGPDGQGAARRRLGIEPGERTIGFFGFLTEEKGVELLLDALECLPEPRPRLVVVGGELSDTDLAHAEEQRRIRARLSTARLPATITGFVPAVEAAESLSALDLIVLPFPSGASLRSGTLIAAVSAGLPLLTTDPAPGDSLAPLVGGESIWLAAPGSVASLAREISLLLADDHLRRRLAEQARAMSRAFRWETIAELHADLYEQVLSEMKGPARGAI